MQALQSEQRSRSQCCTCTLYSWPEVPHAPVPYMPPTPPACAAHKSTCCLCYPLCLLLIFAQYIYFCSSSNVLFFRCPPTPAPSPFCASHTCYASLLLLLTLTSSLTSHAGVLGAIPLCAAPRSAQLLRDVEYKRVEKSRVEQRYGERDIRTGKSGNRNEYVNKKKKKTRRGETRRGRGRNTAKKTRACVLLPVIFVAEEESPSSSSAAGGGVCGTKSN